MNLEWIAAWIAKYNALPLYGTNLLRDNKKRTPVKSSQSVEV